MVVVKKMYTYLFVIYKLNRCWQNLFIYYVWTLDIEYKKKMYLYFNSYNTLYSKNKINRIPIFRSYLLQFKLKCLKVIPL